MRIFNLQGGSVPEVMVEPPEFRILTERFPDDQH